MSEISQRSEISLGTGSCNNWKIHSCSWSVFYSKFRLRVLLRQISQTPAGVRSVTTVPWSLLQ